MSTVESLRQRLSDARLRLVRAVQSGSDAVQSGSDAVPELARAVLWAEGALRAAERAS
jgi:hypothetical protein